MLLQFPGGGPVDAQRVRNEFGHTDVDLREQVGLRRIERVVEVEYPAIDLVQTRRGGGTFARMTGQLSA